MTKAVRRVPPSGAPRQDWAGRAKLRPARVLCGLSEATRWAETMAYHYRFHPWPLSLHGDEQSVKSLERGEGKFEGEADHETKMQITKRRICASARERIKNRKRIKNRERIKQNGRSGPMG